MKHKTLISNTIDLARAVNKALIAVGCVHRSREQESLSAIPVPLERARYDPEKRCVWVEIDLARLPRRFPVETLLAAGFQGTVAAIVGRPVKVKLHGSVIIIVMRIAVPASHPGRAPLAV